MLLLLAWMLWLYRDPVENARDPLHDETLEDLSHSEQHKQNNENNKQALEKPEIIEEEIFQSIDDVTQQSAYDNFDDARKSPISKQNGIVGSGNNTVNELSVFAVSEEAFIEAEMDKLLASPPREQQPARIHSPNSSFTPVQRSRDNNLLVAGNEGEKERKISTSSLNIQIRPHDIVAPNEVSMFEADLHHQYQLSAYHAEDEDSEVAQAFFKGTNYNHNHSSVEDEEDMQYTARNGTKVTITHEAAGRIHSIRVKNKPPQKPTKIRIASPRMRATSPRVRAENISPTIVSIEQDEMVHLVVNKTSPVNVDPEPQPQSKKFKDPNFLDKQKKQLTDFDQIMNKRKKFVDTMDNAGRLLGQIAHRDEKISGGRRQLSQHWLKIKESVRRRTYLQFKDKPMR